MNKLYRLSIPVAAALIVLVAGMLLVKVNSWAVAANTRTISQSSENALLVTTFKDEVITDGV